MFWRKTVAYEKVQIALKNNKYVIFLIFVSSRNQTHQKVYCNNIFKAFKWNMSDYLFFEKYYYKKSANQLKTYYVVGEKNVAPFKSYMGV